MTHQIPRLFSDFAIVGASTAQHAGRLCIPEAVVLNAGTVAQLRLAVVQGRCRDNGLAQVLDTVAPALVALGVVVVINAMAQGGAPAAHPVLSDVIRAHGLSVAVYVDKHAVLCRREWLWFYHALTRGKFSRLEIIRTRWNSDDVLELDSNY